MKRMLSILALLSAFLLLPFVAHAQTDEYTVTINQVEHCTITVSSGYGASKTEVHSGDKIKKNTLLHIKATPEEGYMVTHYIINGEEKANNILSEISESVKGDMSISARVAQVHPCVVTITQPEHGTLTVTFGRTKVKSGDKINSGSRLIVELKPDAGYEIEYWLIDGRKSLPSESVDLRNKTLLSLKDDVIISAQLKKASDKTMVPVTIVNPEFATIKGYKGSSSWSSPELKSGETVEVGSQVTVEITPDKFHSLDYWLVNGSRVEKDAGFLSTTKTLKIVEATTISAVLKEAGYKVTYTQPKHGSLKVSTGFPSKEVPSGSRVQERAFLSVVATVEPGYTFKHFLINGKETPSSGFYDISCSVTVTSDLTIEAVIEKTEPCVVTITPFDHGQIKVTYGSYITPTTVNSGDTVSAGTELRVDAYMDEGYVLDHFLVNGESRASDNETYPGIKITVKESLTLSAVAKASTGCKITLGKIAQGDFYAYYGLDKTPVVSGSVLPVGTEVTFQVNVNEGYEFDYWLVDGEKRENSVNPLVITLSKDIKVEPILKKKGELQPTQGTILIKTEGIGGSVLGKYKKPDSDTDSLIVSNMPMKLPNGTIVKLTANVTKGFQVTYTNNDHTVPVEDLSADGTVYTFTVSGDAIVKAIFTKKETPAVNYTVTYTAGEGGTLTATAGMEAFESGAKIAAGTFVKITATPNENFVIDHWQVNEKPVAVPSDQNSYIFLLEEDVVVNVTFKPALPSAEYAVTVEPVLPSAKAGTVQLFKKDGSVVASGKTVVTGTEMYVEVKPADKYELETLQVNNKTLKVGDENLVNLSDGGYKYLFTVTEATTIKATFKLGGAVEQLTASQIIAYVTNGGTRLEITGAAEGTEVRLYDYTGQLLLSSTEHALDISALPAGSYIVLVGNYTTRIVK